MSNPNVFVSVPESIQGSMPSSDFPSEEKTEPFSLSEYASRLHSFRTRESFGSTVEGGGGGGGAGSVHLDELVVPKDKDIRLLVRPLRSRSVSPGTGDNCEWLALRAEVSAPDQPQETVLAVTQTHEDIKFTVLVPGEQNAAPAAVPVPPVWCELYYDPASDNQILVNHCDEPIVLTRVSQLPAPGAALEAIPDVAAVSGLEYTIDPDSTKALSPGTWKIKINNVDVLDFRILEKRPVVAVAKPVRKGSTDAKSPGSSSPELSSSLGKRSFMAGNDDAVGRNARRQKTMPLETPSKDEQMNEGVIMFLPPTVNPLVFPLPKQAKQTKQTKQTKQQQQISKMNNDKGNQALAVINNNDTISIPGGGEMDTYKLTKRDGIATNGMSTVFAGTTDHPSVPSGSVVTVKVIKARPKMVNGGAAGPLMRPEQVERNVIQQADMWMREYLSHKDLRHDGIVRLYFGDARQLTLCMEHVDGHDLSTRGVWRASNSNYFTGDRRDATCILRNIAGALSYLHDQNLVHNDIKPGNILYSRDKGAMLCDFGLSSPTSTPVSAGGTPYYVPPEFIGLKQRGPPSDVWALGITMLYVLRKIPFPDSRAKHATKPLYWQIADVNSRAPNHYEPAAAATATPTTTPAPTPHRSALSKMQVWLSEIIETKERLDRDDKLGRLTYEMLTPNRNQRIPIKRVFDELLTGMPALALTGHNGM